MEKSRINHLNYLDGKLSISNFNHLDEITIDDDQSTNWINITSVDYTDLIDDLAERFNISRGIIEDVKDLSVYPKVIVHKDYIFMIVEEVSLDDDLRLKTEQVSLILFDNIILSIVEDDKKVFKEVSDRIAKEKIEIHNLSAKSIFYELVSFTVEAYYDFLESMGEKIDDVENELLISADKHLLDTIYLLKRDLIKLRKTLWFLRNSISKLINEDLNTFKEIHDDLILLIDLTETYRDTCSGMLDIYLSSISNKTNDIMKVLTIFSAIFIPLTFLAGVYGMNFMYFPELEFKYGYLIFWIISITVIILMVRFFKKKKWM